MPPKVIIACRNIRPFYKYYKVLGSEISTSRNLNSVTLVLLNMNFHVPMCQNPVNPVLESEHLLSFSSVDMHCWTGFLVQPHCTCMMFTSVSGSWGPNYHSRQLWWEVNWVMGGIPIWVGFISGAMKFCSKRMSTAKDKSMGHIVEFQVTVFSTAFFWVTILLNHFREVAEKKCHYRCFSLIIWGPGSPVMDSRWNLSVI
jgi:hypothetical protein